jgi:hypothetical protein
VPREAGACDLGYGRRARLSLGFKKKQARVMVDRARPHAGAMPATVDVIKCALQEASA